MKNGINFNLSLLDLIPPSLKDEEFYVAIMRGGAPLDIVPEDMRTEQVIGARDARIAEIAKWWKAQEEVQLAGAPTGIDNE